MSQYNEFHRLKREIINKLSSIHDGDRMDSPSDNFIVDVTNSETVSECLQMMSKLKDLSDELVTLEQEEM